MGEEHRPRILCISLSPINSDARVLRQIAILAEFGEVTSVGYGTRPPDVAEHIEVPIELKTLPQTITGVLNLALRRMKASEMAAPALRYAQNELRGRHFDLVVANEARVLAFAHAIRGDAQVWADMHEWAPEERTHILSWRLLVAPLMRYLCKTYLPRSSAVTTVCDSIADLYNREFGLDVVVIRNAGPFRKLSPTALLPEKVKLVHSGAAIQGRALETMIDVVKELDSRYTLDLYLMPGADGGRYLKFLKDRAADCQRIQFQDPVPPDRLPDILNNFDVGVFWLPPTHTNAKFALPNKFFDFVQARLAIAVGPSLEMANLVRKYSLGVVSFGFKVEDCKASMEAFTIKQIASAKQSSDKFAHELSFEKDSSVMRGLLAGLLQKR